MVHSHPPLWPPLPASTASHIPWCQPSAMSAVASASSIICDRDCSAETQDVYSDGSSPHKSMVSDEPEEVFGDSIDEDSQAVRQPQSPSAAVPSSSGMRLPKLDLAFSMKHIREHKRCLVVLVNRRTCAGSSCKFSPPELCLRTTTGAHVTPFPFTPPFLCLFKLASKSLIGLSKLAECTDRCIAVPKQ